MRSSGTSLVMYLQAFHKGSISSSIARRQSVQDQVYAVKSA